MNARHMSMDKDTTEVRGGANAVDLASVLLENHGHVAIQVPPAESTARDNGTAVPPLTSSHTVSRGIFPGKYLRIVCIDGGGVRGICPLVVLAYMEKRIQEKIRERGDPNWANARLLDYVDYVAGTSVGCLIACLLMLPPEPSAAEKEAAVGADANIGENRTAVACIDGSRPSTRYSIEEIVKIFEANTRPMFKKARRFLNSRFLRPHYDVATKRDLLASWFHTGGRPLMLGDLMRPTCFTGFDTVKHKLTLFCSQHVGREIGPLASLTPDDISDPATRNRLSCKGDDFYLTDVGMASSAAPSFWPPAHIFPVTLTDKDGLQQGGGGWNKPEGEGSGSTSTAVAGGGTARSPTRKAASPSNSATPLPTGSSAQPHAQTKAETNTQTQAQPRAEVQGRAQAQALAEIPFNAKAESCGRFMGEPPALQGGGSTCDVDVASSHFTPGTTGDLGAGASGTPNGDSSKAGVSASAVSVATSDQSTVTGSQPLQDRSLEGREGGGFGGGDPGAAPRDPEIVVALKPGGSGGSVAGGGVAKNGPMSVVTKSGLSVSTGAGNGFATSAGGQSRPALDGFRLTPAGLGEATDDGGSRGSSRRSSSREGRQAGTSTSSTSVATGADGREGEGSLFSPPTRTASFINGSHGNAPGPGPAGSTVEMAIPPVLANAAVLPAVVLPDLTVGGLEETAGAGGTGKDTAAGSQARKSRVALLLSRLKRGRNAAPANAKGDVKEAGAKGMAGKGSMTIIDGGVLVNNPSMVACVDLMDLRRRVAQEEGDPGLLRAPTALLSLGTGQEESSMLPYDKVKRWGLRKWLVPLLHIFLDGFSNLNEHYLQHLLCTWTKLLHPHRMQLQNLAR
eukprot:jgi/Mesvir1/14837/Mv05462-RA.4